MPNSGKRSLSRHLNCGRASHCRHGASSGLSFGVQRPKSSSSSRGGDARCATENEIDAAGISVGAVTQPGAYLTCTGAIEYTDVIADLAPGT